MDRAGLAAAFDAGELARALPGSSRVTIRGLGSATFEVPAHAAPDPDEPFDEPPDHRGDLLRELDDLVDKLAGRPDSLDRCRAAYEAYLAEPTVANRERVRVTYEAIPPHNRMYVLRDQDVKDVPVRMVIYGRGVIEGWTHRAVARLFGTPDDQLPDIQVPEPRDE
jgi:hypothetical protein